MIEASQGVNLSLGTVACEVQVGANYLSSVFSQNMQKTFTEYLEEKLGVGASHNDALS